MDIQNLLPVVNHMILLVVRIKPEPKSERLKLNTSGHNFTRTSNKIMNKRKSERIPSQPCGPAFKTTSIHDEKEYVYKNQIHILNQTIESLRRENGSIMYRAESYVSNLKTEFSEKEDETRENTLRGICALKNTYQEENNTLRESLAIANAKIEHQDRIIQFIRAELANAESRGSNGDFDRSIDAF